MAKSFASRILFACLFSLVGAGNAMAATTICGLTITGVMGGMGSTSRICLTNTGVYAEVTSTTSVDFCSNLVTYTVYQAKASDGSGTRLGTFQSCEQTRTAGVSGSLSTTSTPKCTTPTSTSTKTYSVSSITVTGIKIGTSNVSVTAYDCCATTKTTSSTTIPNTSTPRGKKTTQTTGKALLLQYTAAASSCVAPTTPTTYSCTCNTGFKAQNQNTSSCNCDAYASGYSCYVAYCKPKSVSGGAQATSNNKYISADRKSCQECPSNSGYAGITVEGVSPNSSAISVKQCYVTNGTDDSGSFEYSDNCYYTE